MGTRLKKFKPFLPIRRLFNLDHTTKPRLGGRKLSLSLGKRRRSAAQNEKYSEYDYGPSLDPIVDTPPSTSPPIEPIRSESDVNISSDKFSFLDIRSHWHMPISASTSASASPAPLLKATPTTSPSKACLALQTEDKMEDAVIITALDAVPFCCHEDLLTMSREQLIRIASEMNAKLPKALEIDVSPIRSSSFIRNSIEVLVGLRAELPGAVKPTRTYAEVVASGLGGREVKGPDESLSVLGYDTSDSLMDISPPLSPLTSRSRAQLVMPTTGSPLEPMKEEAESDEGNGDKMDVDEPEFSDQEEKSDMSLEETRPPKKRKVYGQKLWNRSTTRFNISQESPTPLSAALLARRNGRFSPAAYSPSPLRMRKIPLSRSPNVLLDEDRKNASPSTIDMAFVTTTRPRYRFKKTASLGLKGYEKLLPKPTSTPNKLVEKEKLGAFLAPNTSWSLGSFRTFNTSLEVVGVPSPSWSFRSSIMRALSSTPGGKMNGASGAEGVVDNNGVGVPTTRSVGSENVDMMEICEPEA
ncbi:hypothetical protein AX16_006711 [Volvariella volvacea WC 439]|nr:hypothetical protein AX16_006711 [Volvariella volvacea WC 439]